MELEEEGKMFYPHLNPLSSRERRFFDRLRMSGKEEILRQAQNEREKGK